MKEYLEIVNKVLTYGEKAPNRTGTDTFSYPGCMIQHDLSKGFPLLTTKKMGIKNIATELEGFIKGETSKKFYQDRKCHIWDEWCNPLSLQKELSTRGLSKDTTDTNELLSIQKEVDDLGPIYGSQWRAFDGKEHLDQLKYVVEELKTNPQSRRLLTSAWNPNKLSEMALPPCHVLWQVTLTGKRLNIFWYQRSADVFLGVPYNLASYSLLLHLLCKETGYEPGIVTGFFADTHIYENHVEQCKIQLEREPFALPTLEIANFTTIYDFDAKNVSVIDYKCHDKLTGIVAV